MDRNYLHLLNTLLDPYPAVSAGIVASRHVPFAPQFYGGKLTQRWLNGLIGLFPTPWTNMGGCDESRDSLGKKIAAEARRLVAWPGKHTAVKSISSYFHRAPLSYFEYHTGA